MIRCKFVGGACLVMLVAAMTLGDAKKNQTESEEPKLALPPPRNAPDFAEVPLTYSNSKRIRIEYECKDVGPSGVKEVHLLYTRNGKTWSAEPAGKATRGSYIFKTFDEGRYGFHFAVISGADVSPMALGLLISRPKEKLVPQQWVEVDVTPPTVNLYRAELGRGALAGTVKLSWSATDKNFGDRPISLYYGEKLDLPWRPIAENIPNTGSYVWKHPKDAPLRVLFRIKAIDLAGNSTVCNSDDFLALDPAEPRAVITGIEPVPEEAVNPLSLPK